MQKTNSPNKLFFDKQNYKHKGTNDPLKPRSQTFDSNVLHSTKPIKINIQNIRRTDDNVKIKFRNDNQIFLNTYKLPQIINRLSLSNFHKKKINNEQNQIRNVNINYNFNIFNKTSGLMGFKGITFNRGIPEFRNTNYLINNEAGNMKPITSENSDINKYKILKGQLLNSNININNNINIINNNLNIINDLKNDKEKKRANYNKNSFNSKAIINNNKYYNNNLINENMNIFKDANKKIKLEKHDEKLISSKSKEKNEEKNNLCDDNNDSFITELHNLFPNEKKNNDSQQNLNEQTDEMDKNNESDDDKEPDPRINFEQINRVNKSRPQTSYGGLNVRRKNLQSAFKNRNSRPATSNVS